MINLDSLKEPVGSIKPWIRPNTSTTLPSNWLICDGSLVSDSASPFNGLTIPDYRARFLRGHNSLTNANFGSDTNYYTGGTIPTGGADSNNLSHQHAEGAHTHGVNSDNATHSHTISADGAHTHNSDNNVTFGHNLVAGSTATFTDSQGSHSHGGGTASASPTHSHGGSTGSGGGSGTDFRLSSTENRPVFTEAVHIIKIK